MLFVAEAEFLILEFNIRNSYPSHIELIEAPLAADRSGLVRPNSWRIIRSDRATDAVAYL